MPAYQVDAASGCRLIGGEMLHWSDKGASAAPGATAPLLSAVVRRAERATKVLALGPAASEVVQELPSQVGIDLLVRALPDARELSSLTQLRNGVTVYCGSLERFEPAVDYDLVVVLDSADLLVSPDSDGLGHAELMRLATRWLVPGGTLMVTVPNELGFDRVFRLDVRDQLDADTMWHRGVAGFDERQLYFRELLDELAGADLSVDAIYASFPTAEEPSMLLNRDNATEPAVALTAATLAARMESSHFSTQPSLVDSYDLALRVFESGLAFELAPAWLVVAHRGTAGRARPAGQVDPADEVGHVGHVGHVGQTGVGLSRGTQQPSQMLRALPALPALPALLASADTGRREWRALTTIEHAGDRWVQRVRPVVPSAEMRERRVVRDYTALEAQTPVGTTLEALLRRSCSTGNVVRVRQLVQQYAEWLRVPQPAPDSTGDGRFFAVPANVVVTDDGLARFDTTWRWTGALPVETLLVRGLRDFARRMLRSGAEHPWTPDISPDALTQTLVAMADVEWDPTLVDAVARAEAELDAAIKGGDARFEALAYQENLESGASQFSSNAGPSRGYREALATSGRMSQALHERSGQVEWLEATLRARDVRVGELERSMSHIRGSISFRVGRVLTSPLRGLVGGVRRLALSMVPPGYLSRARRLLERLAQR